jgi:putative transposase
MEAIRAEFARDIGLEPRTTPAKSPQSNGMAEAFVRTIKRDYARVSPRPNAESVMRQLPSWITHYNEVHPHKALGYRSPVSSSQLTKDPDRVRSFGGYTTIQIRLHLQTRSDVN